MKRDLKTALFLFAFAAAATHGSEWYGADANGTAANGDWSSNGQPGWNGTGVPNAQGAVAIFNSVKKNNVTQDVVGGVTIGSLVLDLPSNSALDLSIGGSNGIVFDQDGTGPETAVISNNAARARISCGSNVPLTLNDDIHLVNATPDTYARTYSISITGKISGTGNLTMDNLLDSPGNGPIILSSASSDFEGSVLVRHGCAKAGNTKAFGKTTNVVTLGSAGCGDATLCFEGTALTFAYPIVVAANTGGRARIYGELLGNDPKKDTVVTLTGSITLDGAVVFDIPSKSYSASGTEWSFTETVDAVISGVGSLTKENAGLLVFKRQNTYSGGTILKAGTLSLTSGATLGTGSLDVHTGATLDLAGDVTVDALYLNGKMQKKGRYAALDSAAENVVKVGWITGAGVLTPLQNPPGLAVFIR